VSELDVSIKRNSNLSLSHKTSKTFGQPWQRQFSSLRVNTFLDLGGRSELPGQARADHFHGIILGRRVGSSHGFIELFERIRK